MTTTEQGQTLEERHERLFEVLQDANDLSYEEVVARIEEVYAAGLALLRAELRCAQDDLRRECEISQERAAALARRDEALREAEEESERLRSLLFHVGYGSEVDLCWCVDAVPEEGDRHGPICSEIRALFDMRPEINADAALTPTGSDQP